MPARHRARAATYCHHARLGVDKYAGLRAEVAGAFADSKGRYGYRRIKAVLKTGVSEKVGPQDHGGGRARGARAQATQV